MGFGVGLVVVVRGFWFVGFSVDWRWSPYLLSLVVLWRRYSGGLWCGLALEGLSFLSRGVCGDAMVWVRGG